MTKEMSVLAPVGNLDSYIRAAYACPMLSQEEEQQLASNLQIHDDLDAA
ncbi:RNA polymerase sigma factor RpoH, partial [Escherichia coli]